MVEQVVSQRSQAANAALRPFLELVTQSPRPGVHVIANFLAGTDPAWIRRGAAAMERACFD
jgi:hypothetical protein